MMVAFSTVAVAAFAALVLSAPTKHEKRQAPAGVPDYVLKYAPVVYLHGQDPYLPSDFQTHLLHTTARVNYNVVEAPSPLDLNNLDALGIDVYLTSNDDITTNPGWIKGIKPDGNGKTDNGVTSAVIVNDKGNGNVDAFYMHFYSYNWGGLVLGMKDLNFGNHVGDWEHLMIRFSNGIPQYVWYSQHANGQAFKYSILEKHTDGLRPIAYSGNGSHALYAIGGTHDHTIPNFNLPGGFLEDHTERGVLWDPLQSSYYYKYDGNSNSFSTYDEATPTGYLRFEGRWGDQEYPTSDKRQVKIFGQAKFASGPTGPRDKQLNRNNVCPENGKECILRGILLPRSRDLEDKIFEGDVVQR
ncbi:hypothetical protein P280DRAFT_467495 [Massarina eburnea CBS 473.64]|uniref:Vacuolar protein sorting-associated protein 62 n=1 Tax=Massarina eburnea CBS 473.64 TaxID=1395130 RepID=A0A6A6SBD4_9PLEO|nr:hypothetical protein P280DRAFT_467495 [Massarina eburnea CBS 473.64]